MSYTILSARYANADHSAAVITTLEAGEVLTSFVNTPDLWPAVMAASPTPYRAPDEVEDMTPQEKLRSFLRANPDVQAVL